MTRTARSQPTVSTGAVQTSDRTPMTLEKNRRRLKHELLVRRRLSSRHALPIVWAAYGLLRDEPACIRGTCGHELCEGVRDAREDLNARGGVTGYHAHVTDTARSHLKRLQKIARENDDIEHFHAFALALEGRDPDLSTIQGCTFYRRN